MHQTTPATRRIPLDGVELAVDTLGRGPAVLLLHGFPHTRAIWRYVAPRLAAAGFSVIAPDLPGLGDSTPSTHGYRADAIAADLAALLDALGERRAHVAGIDLAVAPAFALAAAYPERVASLTLSEGLIGLLPGAEDFLRQGPPWWFGFHQAPGGLAEDVLANSADRYIRHFLSAGSRHGLPDDLTRTIVEAYRGKEALRNAFDHYRAMPATAHWAATWARTGKLTPPALTLGGGVLGPATAGQLEPLATRLTAHILEDCGHITPIDQPAAFARLLTAHARTA
ncbi:alpha/beta fold hydrolase [Pseudosporangium ferrugineum]|uniref:Pimeloyl-ACP methyl ester carboxylesterase n=1 Tax=Pseudosporangium ferrugineum TaxID=439699 RepID=A0A2T0RHF5_9ACTN|nr:alpha/beta hydrolase [Pseudosporangium ferrugineum]PRY20561.1 pimeloyl-ACP methyl ester carboxylesterase [Pseudosporangium ferrugineum]